MNEELAQERADVRMKVLSKKQRATESLSMNLAVGTSAGRCSMMALVAAPVAPRFCKCPKACVERAEWILPWILSDYCAFCKGACDCRCWGCLREGNVGKMSTAEIAVAQCSPEDVLAMDTIWARSKFTDIISAELAEIAVAQGWSEDVLSSPLRFMDIIWARSNGADLAVRDGLCLLILRELRSSQDPIAFKKIMGRAEFFVPFEQELTFDSRVRHAYYKVCIRLRLPYFMSNNAIANKKRGFARPKRTPLVIE